MESDSRVKRAHQTMRRVCQWSSGGFTRGSVKVPSRRVLRCVCMMLMLMLCRQRRPPGNSLRECLRRADEQLVMPTMSALTGGGKGRRSNRHYCLRSVSRHLFGVLPVLPLSVSEADPNDEVLPHGKTMLSKVCCHGMILHSAVQM